MIRMVLILAAVAISLPGVAKAQATHLGPCGDVSSWRNEDWDLFITPLFTDTAADQARVRSDLGIVQQPEGTSARTVTDEKVCRQLEHVVRETLRRSNATTLRITDVAPTYVQVGRYYFTNLRLRTGLPPGTDVRMPTVIIDGSTMTSLKLLWR
jgi:hypothetical protein